MNIDRTTKTILAAIALGLWLNAAMPLIRPKPVRAKESYSCSGELKANAWGGEKASIGGYEVSVTCN